MKLCNFLKENTAMIAGIAACVSAFMAYKTWSYSREISRPAPALEDTGVECVQVDSHTLDIKLKFTFRNVGNQFLKITDLGAGKVDFRTNTYQQLAVKPVLNPIGPNCKFSYLAPYKLTTKEEIADPKAFLKNLPATGAKQCVVVRVVYKETTLFSSKSRVVKYFLLYDGATLNLLEEEQYKKIANYLPEEYKLSNK